MMTNLEVLKREKELRKAFDEYVNDCYVAENKKNIWVFEYLLCPAEALFHAYPAFYNKEFEKWVELHGSEVKND
jgi:hypothetical protein